MVHPKSREFEFLSAFIRDKWRPDYVLSRWCLWCSDFCLLYEDCSFIGLYYSNCSAPWRACSCEEVSMLSISGTRLQWIPFFFVSGSSSRPHLRRQTSRSTNLSVLLCSWSPCEGLIPGQELYQMSEGFYQKIIPNRDTPDDVTYEGWKYLRNYCHQIYYFQKLVLKLNALCIIDNTCYWVKTLIFLLAFRVR
jgi:hypothetical protein